MFVPEHTVGCARLPDLVRPVRDIKVQEQPVINTTFANSARIKKGLGEIAYVGV